jgi:hypothetical protein
VPWHHRCRFCAAELLRLLVLHLPAAAPKSARGHDDLRGQVDVRPMRISGDSRKDGCGCHGSMMPSEKAERGSGRWNCWSVRLRNRRDKSSGKRKSAHLCRASTHGAHKVTRIRLSWKGASWSQAATCPCAMHEPLSAQFSPVTASGPAPAFMAAFEKLTGRAERPMWAQARLPNAMPHLSAPHPIRL